MDIIDELDYYASKKENVSPVFLKVLCILSFVGTGIGLLGAFWALFKYFEAKANFISDYISINNEYQTYFDLMFYGVIFSFVANLLCLLGSILMWHLRSSGFFIYTFGQIFAVVVIILAVTQLKYTIDSTSNIRIQYIIRAISLVFPVIFLVLYGFNFKHLKK